MPYWFKPLGLSLGWKEITAVIDLPVLTAQNESIPESHITCWWDCQPISRLVFQVLILYK